MDFKQPIDITAVLDFLRKYQTNLIALDKRDANEFLKHCTPLSGITDSYELSRVEGGKISRRYNGVFLGQTDQGTIVPRRIIVRPVVSEMADEPERYRRAYITEVPGSLRKQHPFEAWLIQHGINLASNDLYNAIMIAKYDTSDPNNTDIETAFDGLGTIFEQDKAAGRISYARGNVFTTGKITRANIGDVLLNMYRSMPRTFRRKKNIKMFIAGNLHDLYQDWLKDESVVVMGNDDPNTRYILRGTDGKCTLVPIDNLPDDSQFVLLTTQENVHYAYDKPGDFRSMAPFNSGNPYRFTATMKYVIGFQVASVHESEFCINDQPLTPGEKGSIKVNIDTAGAITAGAQWKFSDESNWRNSGTTEADLEATTKTIEFKDATGFVTPKPVQVLVVAGQEMSFNFTYMEK